MRNNPERYGTLRPDVFSCTKSLVEKIAKLNEIVKYWNTSEQKEKDPSSRSTTRPSSPGPSSGPQPREEEGRERKEKDSVSSSEKPEPSPPISSRPSSRPPSPSPILEIPEIGDDATPDDYQNRQLPDELSAVHGRVGVEFDMDVVIWYDQMLEKIRRNPKNYSKKPIFRFLPTCVDYFRLSFDCNFTTDRTVVSVKVSEDVLSQ